MAVVLQHLPAQVTRNRHNGLIARLRLPKLRDVRCAASHGTLPLGRRACRADRQAVRHEVMGTDSERCDTIHWDGRVRELPMSNRETLHSLIETLPNASLETVERVLRNYQTWPPPQPSVDFEKLKQRARERFEKSQRQEAERTGRGVIGGFVGGSFSTPDGDGSASMIGWEGETLVKVEARVFKGHKMELEERFRFSDDQQAIQYSQKIKGPTGKEHSHEIKVDVIKS